MGVLKLVNKAVGSSKEVVEQNKEKLVLRSNMELRKKITEFYYQPDVSYTCPGKKDYELVRKKDGSKEKAVKHILVLTLSEAHSEFFKSEKDCQVSLDVFAKLRPTDPLHRTISKYFQVLGQNKIKVQPFKGAITSKEHRLTV